MKAMEQHRRQKLPPNPLRQFPSLGAERSPSNTGSEFKLDQVGIPFRRAWGVRRSGLTVSLRGEPVYHGAVFETEEEL